MEIPHPDHVPEWLAREMAVRELTIIDLAKRSGVSRNQIGRIKNRKGGTRASTISKLVNTLEAIAIAA